MDTYRLEDELHQGSVVDGLDLLPGPTFGRRLHSRRIRSLEGERGTGDRAEGRRAECRVEGDEGSHGGAETVSDRFPWTAYQRKSSGGSSRRP